MGRGFKEFNRRISSDSKHYLIKSGYLKNGINFVSKPYRSALNSSNGTTGTLSFYEGHGPVTNPFFLADCTQYAANGNKAVSMCTANKIDLTNYQKLVIDYWYCYEHKSTTDTHVAFVIPTSGMTSHGYAVTRSYEIVHVNTQKEDSAGGVIEIDISNLSGEYYIGADLTYRPNSSGGYTEINIYNMWLE